MEYKILRSTDDELVHWGIRGMKWGQRRYQNKDGSLTPLGRKHYKATEDRLKSREQAVKNKERVQARQAKIDAKKAELDAREAALKGVKTKKSLKESLQERKAARAAKNARPVDTSKVKDIKDMTDDELRTYMQRMQLESQYIIAQRNLASLTPQKTNKGKELVKNMFESTVLPAAKNAGKEWLENVMKDKLGLNEVNPNSLKAIEEAWKKSDYALKTAKNNADLKKLREGKDSDDIDPVTGLPKPKNAEEAKKTQDYINNYKTTQKNREAIAEFLNTGKWPDESNSGTNNTNNSNKPKQTDTDSGSGSNKPKQTDTDSDSGSNKPKQTDSDSGSGSNKSKQTNSSISDTKVSDLSQVYGTKEYEARVDQMLADMDNSAWSNWERLYGNG